MTPAVVGVLKTYGQPGWQKALTGFLKTRGTLIDLYSPKRSRHMVPVRLPNGTELALSPGKHNQLHAAVLSGFAPFFAPGVRSARSALDCGEAAALDFDRPGFGIPEAVPGVCDPQLATPAGISALPS